MPNLIANRAFRYASRELAAGEGFDAESKDVVVLTATHNPLARVPVSDDAESPADENRKSRRYSRRDMLAKD